MKARMPYKEALALADELCEQLRPYCSRVAVAGSLRRKKPEIGDLEIVVIPSEVEVKDLFGNSTGYHYPINEWVAGNAENVTKNGTRYKQFVWRGAQVDLFLTTADRWGMIFLIRTGSAEFSKKIMTSQAFGGHMPAGMRVEGGNLFREAGVVPTFEEADVFAALGVAYVEPERR